MSEWLSHAVDAACDNPHKAGTIQGDIVLCPDCGGCIGDRNSNRLKRKAAMLLAKSRGDAWAQDDEEDIL